MRVLADFDIRAKDGSVKTVTTVGVHENIFVASCRVIEGHGSPPALRTPPAGPGDTTPERVLRWGRCKITHSRALSYLKCVFCHKW